MRRILLLALNLVLLFGTSVLAAAWPDNWLGPPENSYRQLNVKVFYYGAVLHDFPALDGTPAWPDDKTNWLQTMSGLPELQPESQAAEFERIKAELHEAARFVWRNTRFNLALDFEWELDLEPKLRSSIASDESPYFSPVEFALYDGLREQYDGLVQIMVLYRYNPETGKLERVRGGGGFTWGLDAQTMECGWSWWAACTEDNACGSDWLLVHEFGHQLDSMFEQSGHPELWFNHLAPLEGNVARFGEHFDANAYILRRIPEADWHDLLWGELREFSDFDADGVPDEDTNLLRLGLETDPSADSQDTDGDGLSDYLELMAANGNRIGHGERLHPALTICDPHDADSDKDGIPDGLDPLPMIPDLTCIPNIASESRAAQGVVSIPSADGIPGFAVALSYSGQTDWEDEPVAKALFITLTPLASGTAARLEFKVMLDLDNDGWFKGTDNYQIQIADTMVSSLSRHNAGSNTEWPGSEELEPAEYGLSIPQAALPEWLGPITLELNQSSFPELAAKPGEVIGLNIGVRQADESWFYMLTEPNTLVPLELR